MKKFWSLVLVLALVLTCAAFAEEIPTELPRTETMYANGQQWGAPNNFNIFALSNTAWPVADNDRFPIYEALYMYNMITGENEPLIAESAPVWEDDYNFTVKIKENVHFNNGQPLTSADVVYTYNVANDKLEGGVNTGWSGVWTYLEKVEAVDDYTVRFTIPAEPYNKVMPISKLANTRIVSKEVSEALFAECDNDVNKVREQFVENPIGTGAFKIGFYDDTRIVCVRDDNYWGQAENMFGKLTEIKYFVHPIYNDNAAGNVAFANGEVDISQQFVNNVGDLVATGNYQTFYAEAPWQLGFGSPSLCFSQSKDGLKDPVIHKAIALALDYDAIAQNAMSGQTAKMKVCFLNPTIFGDYIDFDDEELSEMMWDTSDIDGNLETANAMLDEAGYVDVDGDGMREMPDGSPIEWKAECPQGWSDWNASLEILCESAKKIGLNIKTYFPEASVYTVDYQVGDFEILMMSPYGSPSAAQPYEAMYSVLYSKDVAALGEVATHNYMRYTNAEVDELIEQLGATQDKEEMKEIVTAIIKIWMQDMPTVQLMYRPNSFHTAYTGVWTGFSGAGSDVPPEILTDGASIKDLYNVHAK